MMRWGESSLAVARREECAFDRCGDDKTWLTPACSAAQGVWGAHLDLCFFLFGPNTRVMNMQVVQMITGRLDSFGKHLSDSLWPKGTREPQ